MPVNHKLDQSKEREICLAFLCGVDSEFLCQRYEVSDATIRTNIVGNYSQKWKDPLVEHYRAMPVKERPHNSAHLYLSVNNKDVDRGELVEWPRERPVFEVVAAAIYEPLIAQVEKFTSLAGYLADKSGTEKLLETVNHDWRDSGRIVERLLIERLYQEYQKPCADFSLDSVRRDVAKTIFHKVKYGGLAITPKKAELVDETLATLTDRERDFLIVRFGLGGEKARTLEQLAQEKEITRERARQIEAKAIRRLRHPSRYKILEFVAGLVTNEDVGVYLQEIREAQERRQWHDRLYQEIRARVIQEVAHKPELLKEAQALAKQYQSEHDARPVEELELSVRAQNCLFNREIKTVGELRLFSETELLRTKDFGRKTLKEIKDVLAEIGLRLREDTTA